MINRKKTIVRELTVLMGLMGLMGLASCSEEQIVEPVVDPAEEKVVSPETAPIRMTIGGVVSYVTPIAELMEQTRAWTPPTGFVPYEDGDQIIHVAFTTDGNAPRKGYFFRSGDKWNMSLEENDEFVAGDYYLYGYLPYMPDLTFSITDQNGTNSQYSSGAIITLSNVPTAIAQDLCVGIAAKHGSDKETDAGLRQGDFLFNFKGMDTEAANNYVFMLFDHIYSGLRISMRVHPDYNALRTIKLKALKLNAKTGPVSSTELNNITIRLKATDGSDPSEDPIEGDITYTPVGSTVTEGVEFWSSTNGEELGTTYISHIGSFMPLGVTSLVLTSVYDVYDTKGNLIRQNSKATNTIRISDLLTGQTTTRRGSRYTVNMTINPTYLYMLSDPDLDSPTVQISN